MENLSFSLSDKSQNTSDDEIEEENNTEVDSKTRNSQYLENDNENFDGFSFENKKSQNLTKKYRNIKRNFTQEDSNISRKKNPKKRIIKRKKSIQKPSNNSGKEEEVNTNLSVPKKRRKRSVSKKIENKIQKEELENRNIPQGMKAIKRTKRNSEKTIKTTKTIIRNKDNELEKKQNLLRNFDYSNPTDNQFHPQKEFLDEEDSYQYKSETEISKDNQFEIEISFKKGKENQASEFSNELLPNSQIKIKDINTKSLNYQNDELIRPNNNYIRPNNQKQSFQPKIDEFFYDTYSKPTELRIDTTLVAQSNNRASLKMSEPYQVSTFSKIFESESSTSNQNNEYVLRDLIIASESESNYSSKEPSKNSNNRYNNNSNSDYSEVNTKQKDTYQSRYSNISAINKDSRIKDMNKTSEIKLGKDNELVININISDKFNSTNNNNSIEIETPKQITNSRKNELHRMNETNLSLLNDSQKLNPSKANPKNTKLDKKLMISPSINIQKNQHDLNVVNNCPNFSDTVIVRIENDSPTIKHALQIQQTNSHQQYFSSNNSIMYPSNINKKSPINRNITFDNLTNNEKIKNNHNSNNNTNKNIKNSNKKEKQDDTNNHYKNSKYPNEMKNHRRGDSVPRHKSTHEEPKRNTEEKNSHNNNNYNSQGRVDSPYVIHLHNDGNNYVGNIEFRNGKLVRRIRVRKSQRSSSVVPSHSHNHSTNNNPYYQSNHYESPNKSHNHYTQNQDYGQYLSPIHNYHNHNHFPNDFSNYDHHHHYPQSEQGSNNHHQGRSSSVNRIRVKKNQLYNSDQQNNNNSRHQSHRSNSAPKKSSFPLYNNSLTRGLNDNSYINVTYVYSSDDNDKRHRSFRSEKVNVSTITSDQNQHNSFTTRKEKETQTPKAKRDKNKIGDTFSSSSDEIEGKSVFLDLSNIGKKEEKPAKEKKNTNLSENGDTQLMISSDFGINSTDHQRKKKNHKKKSWNLSHSNEIAEGSSFNSQSESKTRKRKRPISRSSSRSSISISMATPSPSASEIPTSDYEIIQTPLKDFVKNKKNFLSEISSQFQEEEQENENSSHLSLRKRMKQNEINFEVHKIDNYQMNSGSKSNYDSIGNYNRENFARKEKSNISSLFDIASSDDDDNINNTNEKRLPDSSSFTDNSHKKIKHTKTNNHEMSSSSTSKHSHRRRKRVLNE